MSSSARAQRGGRACSRASCRKPAHQTLTYIYVDSTAVLGPLATFAEPHAYDLCSDHSLGLTLPNGWTVIKADPAEMPVGPNSDDLMAIADAVREVGTSLRTTSTQPAQPTADLGRRGHLRALPSQPSQ